MQDKICQSCGMTMSEKEDTVGRNFDGTYSNEYCSYCFEMGEFKVDISLDEMIEILLPAIMTEENGYEEGDEEDAREAVRDYLIKLRRWKPKDNITTTNEELPPTQ